MVFQLRELAGQLRLNQCCHSLKQLGLLSLRLLQQRHICFEAVDLRCYLLYIIL